MNKRRLIPLLTLALLLTGCPATDDEAQGASAPLHADEHADAHGHAHAAGSIAVTHYTDTTELFVEFPRLIIDEHAEFAAHLTQLRKDGFQPVAEGRLVVLLTGGGLPDEKADVGPSDTPGIFRPVLVPAHAGKRNLSFQWVADNRTVTHDIGEVEVFASAQAAKNASNNQEEEAGIVFTKEQQWKIPFFSEEVHSRKLRDSIAVAAQIRPRADGEAIITAPGSGILRSNAKPFPKIGTPVQAGQVLAYLVPKLGGETDIATLNLAVSRARIAAAQARQERERLQGLFEIEAIAEKRLIEARSLEKLANVELEAAQRRLATYSGGNGGIALKSPISGTVITVGAIEGAAVSDGQMLVHVADLSTLWLEARVPETALGRVTQPTGAFFSIDGAGSAQELEVGSNASLIAFGGLIDPESRTAPLILQFTNTTGQLKAGMNLRAHVYTGVTETSLAVPASAIIDDNGQPVVFVQAQGELFERRPVTLGTRDGDWVAVRSGVAEGERVVSTGAYQVRLAATAPAAIGHGHAH